MDNHTTATTVDATAVELYHWTSLEDALKIMKERVFRPKDRYERGGDSGINCFSTDREYYEGQVFAAETAKVWFSWTGPTDSRSWKDNPPFPKNQLIFQERWRAIVPFNTDNFLYMTRIEASEAEWHKVFRSDHKRAFWQTFRKAIEYRDSINAMLHVGLKIGVETLPRDI